MKIENFSTEILEPICEAYKDDERLLIDILLYLYQQSTDDYMKSQIVEILSDMGYCLQCGSKMSLYEWSEARPLGNELMHLYDCPCCGDTRYIEGVNKID